jgi:hypothetical protein
VNVEGKGDPDLELRRLPLRFMGKFRYTQIREWADTFSKGLCPSWISRVPDRSRSLQTLVIDSCQLATMNRIFYLSTPGVLLQRDDLPCPAFSAIILEVPYDGNRDDWVVPFLQMLRDSAAARPRLQKVRIVSNPRAQIPRPQEEKRKQTAKLVRSVGV